MEFTLVYRGKLMADGDKKHKQQIREAFHEQLVVLWQYPPLVSMKEFVKGHGTFEEGNFGRTYQHHGKDLVFAAVVWEPMCVVADLEITLLRPGIPGRIIESGGDIDNRLKTLFDALQIPKEKGQLPADAAGHIKQPFHCLLQDDSLISAVSVKTDRLLLPEATHPSEVQLFIRVRTRKLAVTQSNYWA